MTVDLNRNTIDGRGMPPAVVELAFILSGGPVETEQIIPRLYGLNEPGDARNAIKQLAFHARRLGVPIHGRFLKGCRGEYRLG